MLKFGNSLRSDSRNFFTQERPASTLRDSNFRKGRKDTKFSFSSALLEIAGPEDGKLSAYVKKSVCLSDSEFTDFSKLTIFQGYWKTGLDFLLLLWQ